MRLDLIHLSLLCGQHLRGCRIKSHVSASDLDVHNSSTPTGENNRGRVSQTKENGTKVWIISSSLTNAVIAVI